MDLTPDDRRRAAMACRVAAFQEEASAARQENPSIRATFEQEARKYRKLAERFEGKGPPG